MISRVLSISFFIQWATVGVCQVSTVPPPTGEAAMRVASLRRVGIIRDSSKTDILISELRNPIHRDALYAALRSTAQLGAEKALLDVEEVLKRHSGTEIGNFAVATRARLLAEASARLIPDPVVRAQAKLDRFLRELSLDSKALNSRAKNDLAFIQSTRDGEIRTGLFAMRELADMVYRGSDKALVVAAGAAGIDFSIDVACQHKLRLSEMPPLVRLEWLINELAAKRSMRDEDMFLTQLAVDFGVDAGRLAATKLTTMRTLRHQYWPMGFAALFEVLAGVGDRSHESVLQPFLLDEDEWIRHYAKQAYPNVQRGIPHQCRIAY